MKFIFDSLDAMIAELREGDATIVRVARVIQRESGARARSGARFTARIIVTARIDEQLWGEARFWVGSAPEIGAAGGRVPDVLDRRADAVHADVVQRLASAGFETRPGFFAHDTAAMDNVRV